MMSIDSHKKANAFAKTMCRLFKDSGLHFPLHACLELTAKAAGFACWQALVRTAAFPFVDETKFYDRLLEALPFACRPPFNAWRAGEAVSETVPGYPPRWYLDAIPYFLATMALHLRTPVLAPGSGAGQKMRVRIVEHLMMAWQHYGLAAPLFDPVNFDFVFHGRADDIFAELAEERAFERERDRLVREGILKIDPKTVRLASPGAEAVTSHAVWSRASKAKDWLENDPACAGDPLHEALSLIGVRRARDVAEALLAYSDKEYIMASGPLRDVLSEIANDGDLDVFVHALNVFSYILPGSARELRDAVPAKILNQFVARNRQVPIAGAFRWMQVNPDWADTLRATADRPASFTLTVNAMVEQMRAA
jgi:hypothetical protein